MSTHNNIFFLLFCVALFIESGRETIQMLNLVLGVVVILLILWYLGSIDAGVKKWFSAAAAEGYRSCRDCDGYLMPANGITVINPFVWPYSGTQCIDDLYILNKDVGLDLGFRSGPVTHLNTPDHVVLTN